MLTESGIFALSIVAGIAAIGYGLYLTSVVLKQPAGDQKMQDIALAIQQGAQAYLSRQYKTVAIVALVLVIIIDKFLGWHTALGFIIGSVASALAGYIGMYVAVRANVRTAEAAKSGLKPAFD